MGTKRNPDICIPWAVCCALGWQSTIKMDSPPTEADGVPRGRKQLGDLLLTGFISTFLFCTALLIFCQKPRVFLIPTVLSR